MNARIWGIIGGVALVLALLSPLVLGNSKKIEQLFEAAEELYERSDYEGAIVKYKEALKESKKFGAKTEMIDKDFTTLANLKIAQCYYELAEKTSDVRHYQSALTHIRKVALKYAGCQASRRANLPLGRKPLQNRKSRSSEVKIFLADRKISK